MKRLIVYRTTHCEISVCDQYGVHKEKRATHLNVHECDRTIFFFSLLLKKKRNIRSREAYRTWGNKQSSFFAIVSLFKKKKSLLVTISFSPLSDFNLLSNPVSLSSFKDERCVYALCLLFCDAQICFCFVKGDGVTAHGFRTVVLRYLTGMENKLTCIRITSTQKRASILKYGAGKSKIK